MGYGFYADGDAFGFNPFWRIGKNNEIMELGWKTDTEGFAFDAQGFGNWKSGRMQKSSGNLIGWLNAPVYFSKKPLFGEDLDDCVCEAMPYTCVLEPVEAGTIAFGSWSLSYNAAASAAYVKNGFLPYPKWY